MINVVFLLLIFFLMTARIAPPAPIDVTPPSIDVETTEASADRVLYLASDGTVALGDRRDGAIWADLAAEDRLIVRADAELDAAVLAEVLARLSALGISDISLSVVRP